MEKDILEQKSDVQYSAININNYYYYIIINK